MPVDVRQEQARGWLTLAHAPPEPLVHQDVHRLSAVRALSRDFHFEAFVSEAPFDEGRGKRILRSSAEDPLPRAESQPVRRLVGGYGKGSTHLATGVPDQEKQMLLQVLEQVTGNLGVQPERARNLRDTQRSAIAGQFPNHEVSHRMVVRRHES
jgi:hypothetical protein